MKTILKLVYSFIPFKKNLFSFIKFFYVPQEKIFKHLHFKGDFSVKINNDKKFKLKHFGFQLENEIFWQGIDKVWETESLKLWIKLCENSESIFDVGANTGIYSMIAKCMNESSKVYAFEPIKRVFKKLEENCKINNYEIVCVEKALSNTNGKAIVYDTPTEHVYSVTVNKNIFDPNSEVIKTEIETVTLDEFIKSNNIKKIDLIKIDVETHEPEVLEGFKEYISIFKPTLLIEVLNDEIGAKIEKLVENLDYMYFNIDEKGKIIQVNEINKSFCYNYLICNSSIAKFLNLN